VGYYPFSSKFFSDLTHYVRSGDFVIALIRESRDPIGTALFRAYEPSSVGERKSPVNVNAGRLDLPNENFDLGAKASAGQYVGTDLAYDKLPGKLAGRKRYSLQANRNTKEGSSHPDRKCAV
jgi:hypothetical protein